MLFLREMNRQSGYQRFVRFKNTLHRGNFYTAINLNYCSHLIDWSPQFTFPRDYREY